jgi:hypothetical protein
MAIRSLSSALALSVAFFGARLAEAGRIPHEGDTTCLNSP